MHFAVERADILIGRIKDLDIQSAVIIPKVSRGRWPNGVVAFEFSEDIPFINKLATMQAIDLWQRSSNVEFVELTSTNKEQYPDYLCFIPAQGTQCSSHIGKQGGKQEVKLAPRCNMMSTAHEIGHALGLWHEQSRLDRNQYIRIVWDNIDADHRHNFDQHLTESKDYGPYNFDSLMHYSSKAFSINGEDTM